MTFVRPVLTLWTREIVRFSRQPGRVVGTLATPLLFWIILGTGIGASFQPSGGITGDYRTFFFPGILGMVVLFASIFSNISIIEDRREGFLQSVLVSPAAPYAIAFGKILGGATMALLQGAPLLAGASLLGIPVSFPLSLLALFLLALGLTGLGFCFAWRSESVPGFHAVMNLLLFPMWMLSGALFPSTGTPLWLGILMKINPMTYGVTALREGMEGQMGRPLLILAAFASATIAASAWSAGKTK